MKRALLAAVVLLVARTATAAVTIDAGYPRHVATTLGPSSSSLTAITTTAASFMVAVLHIDSPGGTPTVTAAGGLTWTERSHESALADGKHWVSTWTAPSAAALSSVTITFSFTSSNAAQLDIYSLSGSSSTVGAVTPTFDSNASAAPPQVTVSATAGSSMIIGAFDNYNGPNTCTAVAGTTVDAFDATADELASAHATTVSSGNILVGCSAPSATNSAVAIVEILAAGGAPAAVPQRSLLGVGL